MLIHRGFKYRCYPTPEQIATLDDWQGKQRFLWNLANQQRIYVAQRCRGTSQWQPTALNQLFELTQVRADLPWITTVPRDVQQQLLIELDLAWQRYYKGLGGRPDFKRKGRNRAPIIAPNPANFRLEGEGKHRHVVFPKLGRLAIVYHRPHLGKMKKCAISQDGDAYYVSFSCEIEIADPLPSTKPPIGIDRGTTNTVADSNGRLLVNPKHAERSAKKMKRLQCDAARKQKGSNNQKKAYAKVNRTHRKVRRQRDYVLHVESKYLAKNHGVVVFERLQLKNMTKSARGTVEDPGKNVAQKAGLNRGLLGAGLGKLKQWTAYKVVPEGGRIIEVSPAYTSQDCNACGHRDAASRDGEEFDCTNCGHKDHADVNAAKNVLAKGLQVLAVEPTGTVCEGLAARGRPSKQKLRVVRRGTRTKPEAKAAETSTG